MITMYAQVAGRVREIGTLRALGFPRHSVLGSFLVETLVLAAGIVLKASIFATAMGLLGGMLPAGRAARLPIAESIKGGE
jgi:ABC-type antimicrobial peptide transport system permease subunit